MSAEFDHAYWTQKLAAAVVELLDAEDWPDVELSRAEARETVRLFRAAYGSYLAETGAR